MSVVMGVSPFLSLSHTHTSCVSGTPFFWELTICTPATDPVHTRLMEKIEDLEERLREWFFFFFSQPPLCSLGVRRCGARNPVFLRTFNFAGVEERGVSRLTERKVSRPYFALFRCSSQLLVPRSRLSNRLSITRKLFFAYTKRGGTGKRERAGEGHHLRRALTKRTVQEPWAPSWTTIASLDLRGPRQAVLTTLPIHPSITPRQQSSPRHSRSRKGTPDDGGRQLWSSSTFVDFSFRSPSSSSFSTSLPTKPGPSSSTSSSSATTTASKLGLRL
ncbi:hypothetical protein T439DRAFT_180203 [Meredithblackwellia eburnea MCA 4105]